MSCCSPNKKKSDHSHEHAHSHHQSQDSCCSTQKKKEEHSHSHGHSHGGCCSAGPATNEKIKIHRFMTIEEILSYFPNKAQKLAQEITNAGLHCIGCQAATWETLEGGMMGHGKSEAEVQRLLDRLNALLDEEGDPNTVTITPRGAAKFLEFAASDNKQGWGIRFAEEMAGCSGFEYTLDFAEKADADDQIFVSQGIEIYVKKAILQRLIGSEIDYVDGLRGSGFKISNPNVNSSCGCGTSHGY